MATRNIKPPAAVALDSLVIPFSNYVDELVMVANTAQAWTVPTGATSISVSATAPYAVKPNGTAAFAVASITNGTGSIASPTNRTISGDTMLSFISKTAQNISIEVFF